MLVLLAAVLCLGLWVVLTFLLPVGLGIVHVLLGVGLVLLVRWWVLASPERVS